ncbi:MULTISPECIES: rod shape-determining protein MreD [Legionella]|uniref:rod shape-determining protein MreD n=1 Tax=Legionella TaxID=445 RepID=UPI000F8EC004|nr:MULTISPECIES: rod shape-determining protein MreD [Legionella]MCP0912927.1 rod shape-determining protein MreD [Legionella sp. 27cVA30]RUQ95706.1 rod shape-determining protein MreD [Legionella septentrionalis]RUR10119.1 rod shape-determining protein MreD [Legionella septentrionalis]RUR15490.1 rod shape-determining protein MreD [Legionella septentrionalis]
MIYVTARFLLSLLLTLILTILPMPEFLMGIRPAWVLLLVLYAQFLMSGHMNVLFLLIIGLCLDVLLSTVIGEHAFALLITCWLAAKKGRRFNFFPLGQQMVFIALFCLTYQAVLLLLDAFLGNHYNPIVALSSALLGTVLWPWIRIIADSVFLSKSYR